MRTPARVTDIRVDDSYPPTHGASKLETKASPRSEQATAKSLGKHFQRGGPIARACASIAVKSSPMRKSCMRSCSFAGSQRSVEEPVSYVRAKNV